MLGGADPFEVDGDWVLNSDTALTDNVEPTRMERLIGPTAVRL